MIIYSRTSLATDTDGNLTRLTTVGPEKDEVKTSDQTNNQYLEMIYEQLKVLNFQISTLTENEIDQIL